MERIKKYEPLFGRWYVTKYLGGGSFGSVYQIHSEKDGIKSDSAVKYISIRKQDHVPNAENIPLMETASAGNRADLKSENLDSFQMILKKTKREIELLQKLQGHSNIVTIYDYDIFTEESETVFLIRMELLTSLSDYMKKHSFDKKEVIRLGISLCNALESCSQMQIVHRDIKPDNIFVNRSGEFKLGDFGLSCQNMASASQSLRGQKGTPIYMAPESLSWGQKVDHRTDLYAVAIVLYQLLNKGRIPFCADMQDMEALQNAVTSRMQQKEMKPPKNDNGILWEIIKKACSYEMEDRYQSANEMKMQLEALWVEEMIVKEAPDAENSIINTEKREAGIYHDLAENDEEPWEKAQLAYCYFNGIGTMKNVDKAAKLYEEAAGAGDIWAKAQLAYCYFNGKGKIQDVDKAAKLYEEAACAGDIWAKGQLDYCYFNGKGKIQDVNMAAQLYREAAEGGDTWSKGQLAHCYYYGAGVEKDLVKAEILYREAAFEGDLWAEAELKRLW